MDEVTMKRIKKLEKQVEEISQLLTQLVSDTAYAASWDTVTTIAPSKNAVYDKIEVLSGNNCLSLPTADHTAFGIKIILTAGVNLVFGDVVYLDSTDSNKAKKAISGASTLPAIAIALESISSGSNGSFLIYGLIRDDSLFDFTGGDNVYIDDDTAGLATKTIPPDVGDYVQVIGVGISADIMLFNPQYEIIKRK